MQQGSARAGTDEQSDDRGREEEMKTPSVAMKIAGGLLAGGITLALPGAAFATAAGATGSAGGPSGPATTNCPTPVVAPPPAGSSTGSTSARECCPPTPVVAPPPAGSTGGPGTGGPGTPGSSTGGPGTPGSSTGGPGTPAGSPPGCPPTKFEQAKASLEAALAARSQRLSDLTAEVSASKTLTSQDRSVLEGRLSAESAGISALSSEVPSVSTWKELSADAYQMVHAYRVYTVMSPQVHLVIGADTEAAIEWTLVGLEPGIEKAIMAASKAGHDVSGAEKAFTDYETNVADAESLSAGVAPLVIAQTPEGYPANHQVFVNSYAQLSGARKHLGACRDDLETIVKDLFG